ncbi:unnamed protein product [Chironomus riparius]|uniref:Uncharacterized protein n=1 Tax=Chironomus riparius TaxID=315576 RepID=A0A9N9RJL0_9DIPT|nr:unnamed protein product [Chironomus riparius]
MIHFSTSIPFSILIPVSEAFIVPQEIPSLLSLVYSNIPPIKKGTDSRIGFGYRFGEHADFQVQWELGPQKETQPIGDKSTQSKRNIRPTDEYQLLKTIRKEEKIKYEATTSKSWLSNWFDNVRKSFTEAETTTKQPEVVRAPRISASALQQLKKLYESAEKNKTNETENDSRTEEPLSVQHLPKAALDILQQPNNPQHKLRFVNNKNNRSKERVDSITRDLANVDLD